MATKKNILPVLNIYYFAVVNAKTHISFLHKNCGTAHSKKSKPIKYFNAFFSQPAFFHHFSNLIKGKKSISQEYSNLIGGGKWSSCLSSNLGGGKKCSSYLSSNLIAPEKSKIYMLPNLNRGKKL